MGMRLEAALALRDAALKKFQEEGQFQEIKNFGPVLVWPETFPSKTSLHMMLRTPFQKIPDPSPEVRKKAFLAGLSLKGKNLSYGLDIHTSEAKVLNIEWDGQGKVGLVSFKRGLWEDTVLGWNSSKM